MRDEDAIDNIKRCTNKSGSIRSNLLNKNVVEYLNNRYEDSESLKESIYRLLHNIEIRPVCKMCKGHVNYDTIRKRFYDHCSTTCARNNKDVQEKYKQTSIKRFGVDNYWKTDKCKQEVSKYHKEHKDELTAKKKKTYLERYGVEWLSQNKDFYAHINKDTWLKHQHETKRKNHTFKTSKKEETSYELLKEKFGEDDIIRQYSSDKYPFACDFYIKSLNLYIECNYHWTHGGKPYEGTEDDEKLLSIWKTSNTQYYINAIDTWTLRDVHKRNIAKENNLNWIEFWNINELKNWIENYGI